MSRLLFSGRPRSAVIQKNPELNQAMLAMTLDPEVKTMGESTGAASDPIMVAPWVYPLPGAGLKILWHARDSSRLSEFVKQNYGTGTGASGDV